ncbi:MAG: hypothetical protein WC728_05680 [Elusimicrobiota bacterium]
MKRTGFCCILGAALCALQSSASAVSLEDAMAEAGTLTKKARETIGPRSGREAPPKPLDEPVVANIAYDGWTITLRPGQILALQVTPATGFSSVYPSFDEDMLHFRSRHREPYTLTVYHLLAVKTGETEVSVLACNPGPDNYLGTEETVFKVKVRIQADPQNTPAAASSKRP